jgi:hypothetical protein
MHEGLSRRDLLQCSVAMGAGVAFGLAACRKDTAPPLVCTDTSALSPIDIQIRTALAYVDVSTEPGKTCAGCQQFLPALPGACGACKVVKGPINPGGNCKSFIVKIA